MASDEQSRTGKRAVDEVTRREALAKFEGQSDPLRVLILTALTLNPSSANDLAAKLELPIGRVRYHLGRLRKAGLAELREERPRRGVVERIYFSHPDFISNEEADHLTAEELSRASLEVLRAMVRDATAAIRTGNFYARTDYTAARIPLRLDLKGWKEAAALQHQTLKRLLAIHARAGRRLDDEGAEPINSVAFLLMFETAA
jgi:DNA-binding transcriptional ArsR family regulator